MVKYNYIFYLNCIRDKVRFISMFIKNPHMGLPVTANAAPAVIAGLPVVYRGGRRGADGPAMVTIRPERQRTRHEAPDAPEDNPGLRGLLLDMVI